MAYQALYRQWRPATFEMVVGQEAVVKTLRHQIETGRIAHAYLFCGCRGTGKTTLAKIMSRAINCEAPQKGDPCGECKVCKGILNETTLDVLELDAASNNSVDNIRELLEQVRYPAQLGRYKVYIVDEVHMLSTAAFNALLKTLEEPPAHVVFILATTEPQKLPATILSRVQRYDFGRIPSGLMVERMKLALEQLAITADEEALQMVARAAEGAMRDAFSILDMCVAGAAEGHVSAAQIREVLGASDRDFLFSFADFVAAGDARGVMRQVDALMRGGREPQVFLREMTAHFRALLTVKAVEAEAATLLDITGEDEKRYRLQAERFTREGLLRILSLFMRAEGELRFASTPRIGLEIAALQACETERGEDTAALLERVAELESRLQSLKELLESGHGFAAAKAGGEKGSAKGEGRPLEPKGEGTRAARPEREPGAPRQEAAGSVASAAGPQEPKEVWNRALKLLSKTEPPLFALVRNERFLGAEGDTYRLLIPLAKKEFTYLKLSQPARKDKMTQILCEAAGKPVGFEPVLEGDDSKLQAVQEQVEGMLIEAFGRDMVQIEEGDGM